MKISGFDGFLLHRLGTGGCCKRLARRLEAEQHFDQTVAETLNHHERKHDRQTRRGGIYIARADVNIRLEADFAGFHVQLKVAVAHIKIDARQIFRDGKTVALVRGEGNGRQRGEAILTDEDDHLCALETAAQFQPGGKNSAVRLLFKAGVDIHGSKDFAEPVRNLLRISHG